MKLFRFLEWQVYKNGKELFQLVYEVVKKLPKDVRYDLGSQLIRSSLSVILNIAEGSGKKSDKELNRYLNISIGSLNETVAGMDVLLENKFINGDDFSIIISKAESISKQLGGFKKTL